jgi:L-lactate dehydrogenase (cytochrome)
MPIITCVEDLRKLSRRRVPKMFYDYLDSGSWTESSYRANGGDLGSLLLRQRVGIDTAERSTGAHMMGEAVAMPVALAPAGLTGMQYANGEILAARAAERFGVPYVLSTMSICSIEDVAAHTSAPFWFQLYLLRDRDFVSRLMQRARAAACPVLVLTMDLPVMGQRHQDLRNQLRAPPAPTLSNLLGFLARPRWCLRMLGTRRRSFGNVIGHVEEVDTLHSLAAWTAAQLDPSISWADVAWVRKQWQGKLIIKGIMDADDARQALACGADGLIVSNHGGRQLDGTCSSVYALPAIVEAVGHQLEVHLDGGVRSGQDVLRALSLGARGVYIGRPYLYGLGALGESGVTRCLDIIHKELDLTMALCGIRSLDQAGPQLLLPPRDRS